MVLLTPPASDLLVRPAIKILVPIRSPRTGLPLSTEVSSDLPYPASELPLICPGRPEIFGPHVRIEPRSWSPKGKAIFGWVSCLHLVNGIEIFLDMYAVLGSQCFYAIQAPDRKRSLCSDIPDKPLEFHELNRTLVVHWGEQCLLQCVNQPAVRALMAVNGVPEHTSFDLPVLTIVESCGLTAEGNYIAGQARGRGLIEVSSWVLPSREEYEATLRHECSHILVAALGLDEPDPHGENFRRVLRAIAPTTCDNDLKCNSTPAMRAERERIHGGVAQSVRQLCGVGL